MRELILKKNYPKNPFNFGFPHRLWVKPGGSASTEDNQIQFSISVSGAALLLLPPELLVIQPAAATTFPLLPRVNYSRGP